MPNVPGTPEPVKARAVVVIVETEHGAVELQGDISNETLMLGYLERAKQRLMEFHREHRDAASNGKVLIARGGLPKV